MRRWVAIGFAVFGLFFLLQTGVWAEEESEEVDSEGESAPILSEIVVHENRGYAEPREDKFSAGTALVREDFDDAGERLPTVINEQAGVRASELGGAGAYSTLSIRGSSADQVLVLLDGVALNAASGGPVDLSRLPLGNISRIEIYRGSAPFAFGASAIGGALSLTTRSGRKREFSFARGGGSFGTRNARIFYAEPSDNWDFALGLDYFGTEGSYVYTNDNGTRFTTEDDFTDTRRNNYHDQGNMLAKFRLRLSPKWRLTFMEWLFMRHGGVAGLGLFQASEANQSTIDSLFTFKVDGFQLADIIDWTAIASMRVNWQRFHDPDSEIGLGSDKTSDISLSPELRNIVRIDLADWLDFKLVAAYRYDRFDPGGDNGNVSASERHNEDAGGEFVFSVDAIDLDIGLSARGIFSNSSLNDARNNPGAAEVSEAATQDWAARIALANTSIPDTRLTLTAGRGVRLPSLFELFGNNGQVLGNPALQPETALSADAGIVYESSMLPHPFRLRLELYGFYSDVSNLIQFIQTAQNVSIAENLDSARHWGIEAGGRADLFGHWRLAGNYTFLRARNTGESASRKGKALPNRPASQWFARTEVYASFDPWLGECSIFGETDWIAGNFLDNANLVALGSRFRVNAGMSASLPGDRATLQFTVNNISNEQRADLVGYPLPGRSFFFRFSAEVL